jgi:hypothetical protein
MDILFAYLIKSVLYTTIFYGVYHFFLRSETFYRFNRFFLLLGLIASIVLPLISFNYEVALAVTYADSKVGTGDTQIASTSWMLIGKQLFCYGYFIIGALLLLRQFLSLWKLKKLANSYGYTNYQGCRLITSAKLESSFSVVNYVFLATPAVTSAQEKSLILEHELAHVKQYHWVDLLVLQLFSVLQWFNPLVWLYGKAIQANHEFLADQTVLANGNSAARYRATLVNQSLKVPVFVFTSAFLGNSRLDRLKMMHKASSSPIKQWSVLLVLPLVLLVLFAFAEPEYTLVANNRAELTTQREVPIEVLNRQIADQAGKNKTLAVNVNSVLAEPSAGRNAAVRIKSTIKLPSKEQKALVKADGSPLLLINGVETNFSLKELNPAEIESINVYKDISATEKFGEKGKNGAIEVTLKKIPVALSSLDL